MAGEVFGTSGPDVIYQRQYGFELDIWGYGGNDRIYLNVGGVNGGFNWVNAGSGDDRVRNFFEGGNDIYLGPGNDTYIGTGWSDAPSYWDQVFGGHGADTFDVTTNQSDYYGEKGNDYFFSVGFNNYFNGGAGNDTISYETQDFDPDLFRLGVYIHLGNGFAQTFDTNFEEELVNIENAIGTGVADDIYGSSGDNSLWGDGGADILDGLGGKDVLYGSIGWDDLYGGAGNDKLVGGRGYDLQWGNSGADRFVFKSIEDSVVGQERDVIKDFSRSQGDHIDVHKIDADPFSSGNQAFDFIGTASFSETAGELRFSDGKLAGDTNGDGEADFQVAVNGWNQLNDSDFFL